MEIFKFKQFQVDQTGCAMRINTDGVLLGAMVHAAAPMRILDIGSGTGVIAMMLAQRYPHAQVVGVEIDASSAERCAENFKNSVFKDRLSCVHQDFLKYDGADAFDLIVSNPPFFTNDLKNPDLRKGVARHTNEAFFETLISKCASLLTAGGTFSLVLPLEQVLSIEPLLNAEGLFIVDQVNLCSFEGKAAFRQIVSYSNLKQPQKTSNFVLYEAQGVHSDAYRKLLKDFFLKF